MLRSYCTCGWSDVDDDNDTKFNNHVFYDMSGEHKMCSLGEWNLCRDIFEKDNTINNLESQLESNCSEEVIILREKVLLLEKQVETLREKLYAITNEQIEPSEPSETRRRYSRLTQRRKTHGR